MKIIVCIKQVPNTTEIKIDPVTNTLKRDGVPSIINPDDKAAIEAALQLKESNRYDEAEAAFEALEGYENSADHIEDIRWARFFDTLLTKSEPQEDGTYRYSVEDGTACILVNPEEPQTVQFYTEYSRQDGFSLFDSLLITCRYQAASAEYHAVSKFTINLQGKPYGSTQTCSGKVASSALSLQTVLAVENYNRETLDIQGKTHNHSDPSDNSMEEGMAVNLQSLLPQIPGLLQSLDERFTPELLGLTQLS